MHAMRISGVSKRAGEGADVDDGRFEQELAGLLRQDYSAGTGAFCEELLARCLAVVNSDMRDDAAGPDAGYRIVELDDADLGMLAAAGDFALPAKPSSLEGSGMTFGRLPGLDE